ncbi:hypothetical protein M758_7G114900 [Ceratodon purpureus]|nr:hypothetical protein M758_7G114900 [Ceratodon purpureus]
MTCFCEVELVAGDGCERTCMCTLPSTVMPLLPIPTTFSCSSALHSPCLMNSSTAKNTINATHPSWVQSAGERFRRCYGRAMRGFRGVERR